MKIVLKRDKKLANPPTFESTAAANRIRRKVRSHCREVQKAVVKNSGDKTCSICIEANVVHAVQKSFHAQVSGRLTRTETQTFQIDDVFDTEVTSCGHLFHKSCFHEYKKQKAMVEIEKNHHAALYDSDEAHYEAGKAMVKVLVGYDSGFACPNCRCKAPLIHQLAKRTVVRARPYELGCVSLELSSTDVLALVTRR